MKHGLSWAFDGLALRHCIIGYRCTEILRPDVLPSGGRQSCQGCGSDSRVALPFRSQARERHSRKPRVRSIQGVQVHRFGFIPMRLCLFDPFPLWHYCRRGEDWETNGFLRQLPDLHMCGDSRKVPAARLQIITLGVGFRSLRTMAEPQNIKVDPPRTSGISFAPAAKPPATPRASFQSQNAMVATTTWTKQGLPSKN